MLHEKNSVFLYVIDNKKSAGGGKSVHSIAKIVLKCYNIKENLTPFLDGGR